MEEPCYAAAIPSDKYDSSLSHVSFFLLLLTPFQFCNSSQSGMEVLQLYTIKVKLKLKKINKHSLVMYHV